MTACGHADAVLDALALTEARIRGDDEAQAAVLDHGDNRAQALALAEMLGHFLAIAVPDPLAATARLRSNYAARGS
jgi:hypothetical protein